MFQVSPKGVTQPSPHSHGAFPFFFPTLNDFKNSPPSPERRKISLKSHHSPVGHLSIVTRHIAVEIAVEPFAKPEPLHMWS